MRLLWVSGVLLLLFCVRLVSGEVDLRGYTNSGRFYANADSIQATAYGDTVMVADTEGISVDMILTRISSDQVSYQLHGSKDGVNFVNLRPGGVDSLTVTVAGTTALSYLSAGSFRYYRAKVTKGTGNVSVIPKWRVW